MAFPITRTVYHPRLTMYMSFPSSSSSISPPTPLHKFLTHPLFPSSFLCSPSFLHVKLIAYPLGREVGIVTRLGAGRSGVRLPEDARDSALSETSKLSLVLTQPPGPLLLNRTTRDVAVENEWSYTPRIPARHEQTPLPLYMLQGSRYLCLC